ncbi:Maf-like protein [Flavobacterium amniphilum]|uniref:Maf-like protein n=1 Tax=Flavobacterium amniphilum TaxID=1834035 RepID=UPI00202A52A9|nr:Maf-like protein [Flavobacterium amniphilum]MCL9805728.1 Maf-like protein [Flavobacterium amniphilum]MCL9806315.1 Maf-like protein [Flavobacterium amniphilum]
MLRNKFKDTKIILASGSPRRQQFFKDLDLDFEIRLKEIEEIFPPHLQSYYITNYLAKLKADVFTDLADNELLITSDTLVWLENEALGKPVDEADAIKMLQKLAGKTHQVVTSVCFKTQNSAEIIHDITQVTFNDLSLEAIEYYIQNYKPLDKAGSYGIQDWIGLVGISKIEGSYTNVVGLPTEKVYQYLLKL